MKIRVQATHSEILGLIRLTKNIIMKNNKQWDIRGAVSFAGFFHFLHSCASGCLLPFLTLYLRYLGLTAFMTGIVMAAKHTVALVWRPISSVLARRHNKRRMVIIGSLICSTAVALTLLLFPSMGVSTEGKRCNSGQPNVNHTASESYSATLEPRTGLKSTSTPPANTTLHTMISTETQSTKSTQTIKAGQNESSRQPDIQEPLGLKSTQNSSTERRSRSLMDQQKTPYEFLGSLKVMDSQHQMFFLAMIIVGLWEIMAVPVEWTADDGLHEYLDFVDATEHHGLVKPWRMLGTAGGMGGTGILVSIFYCLIGPVLHFYIYTMLMVLMLPVAALLPLYRHKRERVLGAGWKALHLVFGDSRAILGSLTSLLTGMAGSVVSDFLLWHMQDLDATELQMGIILALTPLCQAVCAPLNGSLTRLLKSHERLLLLGILGLSLQCLYYSFLWTPWAALPAQLLAGLSAGAIWWSLEAQCMDIASPGTEVAVQRVFKAMYLDLGAGLGSVAGGFVVQTFGIKVLFQVIAVMLGLWFITLAVLQWRIPRQRRINYSRLLAADASDMSDSESEQETDWLQNAMVEDRGNNNLGSLDK